MWEVVEFGTIAAVVIGVLGFLLTPADQRFNAKQPKKNGVRL